MNQLNHFLQNKSLFITRDLTPNSVFNQIREDYNVAITDQSLIKIVQIPFTYTPQTAWVFFSSKNAIKYFFAQDPKLPLHVKYGVVSKASETELMLHGKTAAFVGAGTDLVKIAKDFREVLQNESVLFPQAMDSLQTIQKQLAFTNTLYNLYTYKTILKADFELPYTDIVIFTSPSNVVAYFAKYKLDSRQLIVAMGASTKYKLSEYGFKNVLTPKEFSEEGLCAVVVNSGNNEG